MTRRVSRKSPIPRPRLLLVVKNPHQCQTLMRVLVLLQGQKEPSKRPLRVSPKRQRAVLVNTERGPKVTCQKRCPRNAESKPFGA